jgi:hypothetical protein
VFSTLLNDVVKIWRRCFSMITTGINSNATQYKLNSMLCCCSEVTIFTDIYTRFFFTLYLRGGDDRKGGLGLCTNVVLSIFLFSVRI